MNFIFITNNPDMARHAYRSGAEWVMVDLEKIGKYERQGHLDTLINNHKVADIDAIRSAVPHARLIVRTNPLHKNSLEEVEAIIERGADMLMLPWFHSAAELAEFARIVNGRVSILPLVETKGAIEELVECCTVAGVDRVHIGLNDLSLELGRRFMFELLIDGTVEKAATQLKDAGIPFGIGGIARCGEGLLPAEKILVEHVRVGSDAVILSRTFHRNAHSQKSLKSDMNFALEVAKLRDVESYAKSMNTGSLLKNVSEMKKIIENITKNQ